MNLEYLDANLKNAIDSSVLLNVLKVYNYIYILI